jgi:hypothetical protein
MWTTVPENLRTQPAAAAALENEDEDESSCGKLVCCRRRKLCNVIGISHILISSSGKGQ